MRPYRANLPVEIGVGLAFEALCSHGGHGEQPGVLEDENALSKQKVLKTQTKLKTITMRSSKPKRFFIGSVSKRKHHVLTFANRSFGVRRLVVHLRQKVTQHRYVSPLQRLRSIRPTTLIHDVAHRWREKRQVRARQYGYRCLQQFAGARF